MQTMQTMQTMQNMLNMQNLQNMQNMQNMQYMQNMKSKVQYSHSISRTCSAQEFGLVVSINHTFEGNMSMFSFGRCPNYIPHILSIWVNCTT